MEFMTDQKAVAEAIYNADGDAKFTWEEVQQMAKKEGYIAAQGTVELVNARAKAAIAALQPYTMPDGRPIFGEGSPHDIGEHLDKLVQDAAVLDPDMPAQELRLHMGELTAQEERTARAVIRWANSCRQPDAPSETEVREAFEKWFDPCNIGIIGETDARMQKLALAAFQACNNWRNERAAESK